MRDRMFRYIHRSCGGYVPGKLDRGAKYGWIEYQLQCVRYTTGLGKLKSRVLISDGVQPLLQNSVISWGLTNVNTIRYGTRAYVEV